MRATGRLPKYNPERRKTFSNSDWQHVCGLAIEAFRRRGLAAIVEWLAAVGKAPLPRKRDQDGLDACLCLLVALYLTEGHNCLMVGDRHTGYIVIPDGATLRTELQARCHKTGRIPSEWVRVFRLCTSGPPPPQTSVVAM
jgi:predicted RNase H-like nuclease